MRLALVTLSAFLLTSTAAMADSVYCPQNSGFINTGMSEAQVSAACGQPLSKQTSSAPVMQKIPVKQLIYMQFNTDNIYPTLDPIYQQWSLSGGVGGFNMRVDIIDGKVSGVTLNGSNSNATSICNGISLQAGDTLNKVYGACGAPGMVNDTFINQPIPSNTKPEIWIYQLDKYHPPMSLTFVNGKLQSIN